MKTLLTCLVAIATTVVSLAADVVGPNPPPLKELLKRPNPQLVMFRPVRLAPGQRLNLTHIRVGDGSVKPGSAVQLVVYSSVADEQGEHEVLFTDFHFVPRDGSPVLNFNSYVAPTPTGGGDGRTGIIAILIGLNQRTVNSPFTPAALPPQDIIAAEILDGTGVPLLLPAVQKVRQAAARQ